MKKIVRRDGGKDGEEEWIGLGEEKDGRVSLLWIYPIRKEASPPNRAQVTWLSRLSSHSSYPFTAMVFAECKYW